jgi:phage tail P2-like protein
MSGLTWDSPGVRWDGGYAWDGRARERLLPTHCAPQELALEDATARIAGVGVTLRDLWRPQTCPSGLLPWLAWALSVDEWDAAWDDVTRRTIIAESALLHARKGTPWAVRRALELMGYRQVRILEGTGTFYRGEAPHDGSIDYASDLGPYEFDVLLSLGSVPSPSEQAEIRRRIDYYKNARSHLRYIVAYDQFYDGVHAHDGVIIYHGGTLTAS